MKKVGDHFWDFRFLIRHVQEKCTDIAEAYDNTAFDEMRVKFSGRHRGVTYAWNKPKNCIPILCKGSL